MCYLYRKLLNERDIRQIHRNSFLVAHVVFTLYDYVGLYKVAFQTLTVGVVG